MRRRSRIGTRVTLSVSIILGGGLLVGLALVYLSEKRQLQEIVHDKAERLVLALEAGHTMAMKHRGDKKDGNPVLDAFNGSIEYLSDTQDHMKIWLFMAPKVLDYQTRMGHLEIEPPLDDVDQAALDRGTPVGRFVANNIYRYSVPIALGLGPAKDPVCASCHGQDMGIEDGEPIGGFAVAYNATQEFGQFGRFMTEIITYSVLLVAVIAAALIFIVSRLVSRPIADAAHTLYGVALSDTEISIRDPLKSDSREITEILDAARIFNNFATSKVRSLRLAMDEHAIVSITDTNGTITFANDKFSEQSGYAVSELIGQNHRLLKSDEHERGFYEDMWRTISSGKTWHGEIKNKSKDGGYYWEAATIVPFRNEHDEIFQYVAICTNITKTKTIESELRASQKAAEAASLAKSNFLATMSHELRTPLTSIKGALGLLHSSAGRPDGDAQVELFGICLRNTDVMMRLIDELLDFEKITSGNLVLETEVHDIDQLVEKTVIDNQGYATTRGVTFRYTSSKQEAFARVNEHRFQQVVRNLLSNAAKFSHPGDTVDISVLSENGEIVVRVKDRGLGIPASFRPKIFEAFTQLDSSATRQFAGTGLGLSISKALIESMDGTLEFDSEVGVGSVFYVHLPIVEQLQLAQQTVASN